MKIIYKAEDGTEFNNEKDCVAYERGCSPEYKISELIRLNAINFTYSYGELEELSKIITDNFGEVRKIIEKEKPYTLLLYNQYY